MRKIVLVLILVFAGFAIWYIYRGKPKPDVEKSTSQAMKVSKHSPAFNLSVNKIVTDYYGLSEAFVGWDSTTLNTKAKQFESDLEAMRLENKEKDSIDQVANSFTDNVAMDLKNLQSGNNLSEKRKTFNSLSQNMYDLLRTLKYDDKKVFLQLCPMAFGDTGSGLWLSPSGEDEQRRNPYLGLHHPKYKSGMLTCGETKDSLNF